LADNWRTFIARAAAGRVDPDDLALEFRAQLEAVTGAGLQVSHLDTHQHLHLWPLVRDVVLRLAVDTGIAAVRVPRATSAFPGAGVNILAHALARRARSLGIAFPGRAAGVDEAGRMGSDNIVAALARLAATDANAVELSAHPGEQDDPDRHRYAWDYRWGDELRGLTSNEARAAVDRHGFVLGTYGDLARWAGDASR
jgi:predicted glycoside hydrolase/deacetylase ChbG (UPF0249 family)